MLARVPPVVLGEDLKAKVICKGITRGVVFADNIREDLGREISSGVAEPNLLVVEVEQVLVRGLIRSQLPQHLAWEVLVLDVGIFMLEIVGDVITVMSWAIPTGFALGWGSKVRRVIAVALWLLDVCMLPRERRPQRLLM